MKHTVFCILGRSATGKDTLVRAACQELNMNFLNSYTTRQPRAINEDTHIFATEDVLMEHAQKGAIAACSKIGEYWYWSTIEQLQCCDFYVTDYVGLQQIQALDLPDIKLVVVYIIVPEEERRQRALLRTPNAVAAIEARSLAEAEQFAKLEELQCWNYSICNDKFAVALEQLKQIIYTERT